MINPKITNNNGLKVIDEFFNFDIPLSLIFHKYIVSSHLINLDIYFTCKDSFVLSLLSNYFDFTNDIRTGTQNLIVRFDLIDSNSFFDGYRNWSIEEKDGIEIGNDNLGKKFYLYNYILVKSSLSGQYIEVYYKNNEQLQKNFFWIIKTIESRIALLNISNMSDVVHGDLYKDDKGKLILAFGPSLSGKTSYFNSLSSLSLIGDEILCVTKEYIFPLVNYVRKYVSSTTNITYYEDYKGIIRSVAKQVPIKKYLSSDIKEINILYRSNSNKIVHVKNQKEKAQILLQYFNNGVLQPFLETKGNFELITSKLCKKDLNIIYHK